VIGHREFFGLAVDAESVFRAIENEQRPGYHFPGMWFTPEEELEERTFDRGVFERVEAFAVEQGAEIGHTASRWLNGKKALEISIQGDVDRYRELLTARFGSERLIVRPARFSERERLELADRVGEDTPELAELGIHLAAIHPGLLDREEGVHVSYWAIEQLQAKALLLERYGPMIVPEWLGTGNPTEEPRPFGSYVADGTTLTVFYPLTCGIEEAGNCTAQETDDKVIVTLTVLVHAHYLSLTRGWIPSHAGIELSAPLGKRAVIDAVDGAPRPQWSGSRGRG
jgi:hypothetical protein